MRLPLFEPAGIFSFLTSPPSVGTDRCAETGFPRRDRQRYQHVAPTELELPIVVDADFQQQVAGRRTLESRRALPGQPDLLTRQDACRNPDLERALAAFGIAQRDALAPAAVGSRQRNGDARFGACAFGTQLGPSRCMSMCQWFQTTAQISHPNTLAMPKKALV
jgi:hypothetical protein